MPKRKQQKKCARTYINPTTGEGLEVIKVLLHLVMNVVKEKVNFSNGIFNADVDQKASHARPFHTPHTTTAIALPASPDGKLSIATY